MCAGALRRAALAPGAAGRAGAGFGTVPIAPLILFFVPASSPNRPTTHPAAGRMCLPAPGPAGAAEGAMSEELSPLPGRLAPGSQLAGYRIEEEIGRGGMAVVYRAHDDHLDRRVALKVLAPDLARDEVFRARFIQESRIAAAAEHPNIIPVFSAGEAGGVLYIAMRYVPDGDVRTLVDRVGPLPPARACALIAQAASALDAAHARGLVHRDVKPTNMLLEISPRTSRPDHLYLSDFGPAAAGSGAPAGSSAPRAPASSAPTAPASSSALPAPPSPPPPGVLAATVREYYAAINNHRYARAWRLGGRNTGQTFHAFVSGFAGTAHDSVTIRSVSGDVVTAQLVAQQTDGTVKTYQGSYTVEGGVITQFDVQQVS